MKPGTKRAALSFAVLLGLVVDSSCGGGKGPVAPVEEQDTAYNIEIRYFGEPVSDNVRTAFSLAADRIQRIITAGVAPVQLTNYDISADTVCGVPNTKLTERVDDLIIYATVKQIDGAFDIQATSGPCLIRNMSKLPVVGSMVMDRDDLNRLTNNGQLNAVVLHEMLHVVGFGTIWDSATKKLLTGEGGQDPRFIGEGAKQGCTATLKFTDCGNGVPVESCAGISQCGTGTRDSHWRESTFGNELMTGFLNPLPMPLSAMSIRSLGDLGYTVNVGLADPYPSSISAIRAADSAPTEMIAWERTRRPSRSVPAERE